MSKNLNKTYFIAIMLVLATTLITSTIVAIEPAQAKSDKVKDKIKKDSTESNTAILSFGLAAFDAEA